MENGDWTPVSISKSRMFVGNTKIRDLGKVDLFLDAGRRYLFYLTPHKASRDDLLRNHRPWPFIFRAARSSEEATLIGFQVWTVDPDCHRAKEAGAAKSQRNDQSPVSFGPVEHDSTAAARTTAGKAVQDMVDAWALSGLIDGGAMIDTRESFSRWRFWCPRDQSSADEPSLTPTNPYGGKPTQATWHYVIPANDEHGIPWMPLLEGRHCPRARSGANSWAGDHARWRSLRKSGRDGNRY